MKNGKQGSDLQTPPTFAMYDITYVMTVHAKNVRPTNYGYTVNKDERDQDC